MSKLSRIQNVKSECATALEFLSADRRSSARVLGKVEAARLVSSLLEPFMQSLLVPDKRNLYHCVNMLRDHTHSLHVIQMDPRKSHTYSERALVSIQAKEAMLRDLTNQINSIAKGEN